MPSYVVRCGIMRTLHVMSSSQEYARGTKVIARTPRGLEAGEVLCESSERAVSQLESPPSGSILRPMTVADANELAHLAIRAESDWEKCAEFIRHLGLPMDLVEVERIFGGERIVVYYLSEDRIDFRELVRLLAAEFQTRVEMRQIGVRDEAKLIGDYGDCGKPLCCNTHLTRMPPVSMRMAKLQKATLDPTKISGRCGRLKCCLRYEFETYEENLKSMPRVGAEIVTSQGRGRVLSHELLSRQMLVAMEDDRRIMIRMDEVLTVLARSSSKEPPDQPADSEDAEERFDIS